MMATSTKRGNSYKITSSCRYDISGKQIRQHMTWTPRPGMTERQIEKELDRQKKLFDEQVKNDQTRNGNIRFQHFAEQYLREYVQLRLKAKTAWDYQQKLERINRAIGHIKLKDLKPAHINSFYAILQEDGMHTQSGEKLSQRTVHAYHRVLSAALSKAVKWEYISENPAKRAAPPPLGKPKTTYLDEPDARRLLELLHNEPIRWRTMITFDLLSGLRRGELLGLRWCDIDAESQTIVINQTSNYVPGRGVYIDTPKNDTSNRPLHLTKSVFILLEEYKAWQDNQRDICGDAWRDKDGRVFTAEDGAPVFPDSITQWFSKFVKRVGLPKVTVHSLRHTYASLMIAEDVSLVVVSNQLGHANPSTTANIYAHAIASAKAKAAQTLDKFADVVEGHSS